MTAAVLSLTFALSLGAGSAFADSKMDKVIDSAMGTTYKSGGTTLDGFDCSGFTRYVFGKLGIDLARQSSSQYDMGDSVSRMDMRPGDLVFFNTSGKGISHVGIFVGDGKFAHSSSSKGVTITSLSENYWANRYVGAKRIMSTDVYESLALD
nr:C40 family peptidase [Paenibacillus sp. JJ-100]